VVPRVPFTPRRPRARVANRVACCCVTVHRIAIVVVRLREINQSTCLWFVFEMKIKIKSVSSPSSSSSSSSRAYDEQRTLF
jgi:hypothetical protein